MHETIDGETIIINVATGTYYSLDGVGSEIWRALELTASIDAIVDVLAGRYDAPRDTVAQATHALLDELQIEELVVPSEANGQRVDFTILEPIAPAGSAFKSPKLEKHTDMQDLILLDPVHEIDPQQGWPQTKAS